MADEPVKEPKATPETTTPSEPKTEPKVEPKVEPTPEVKETKEVVVDRTDDNKEAFKGVDPKSPTTPPPVQEPKTPELDKEALFKEWEERQLKKQEETQKEEDARRDDTIRGWYSEYNMIASSSGMPEIKNEKDKNDPGVQARSRVIQKLAELRGQGKDVRTLSQVLLLAPELRRVAGADAPISGATTPQTVKPGFSHQDLRNTDMRSIATQVHNERVLNQS